MAKTPDQVSGLVLWLDADAITGLSDGNAVATWEDQSAEGNDLAQATADYRPTYQTGELNGKPVVRFDGSNDFLEVNSFASGTISQPNTVFMVVRDNVASGNTYIFDGVASDARHAAYFRTSPREMAINCGAYNGGFATATQGNYHYITLVVNNGSSDSREDGSAKQTGVTYGTNTLSGLTLGCDYQQKSWSEYLNGEIAEFIIYDGEVSGADILEIEAYLVAKWFTATSDTELVVADIDIDLAFDAPTLTQAHALVVSDVDIDLAFDGAGAGDGLWDIGAYIYPLGGDGIILVETEATSLTVSDISLALAFDAPVLTQAHTLVVADATLDLAFEAPVLTSVLVVDDVAIALSFESMALTQAHTLVTDDVVFALSFEDVVLSQLNTLSVANVQPVLSFESPTLTQAHTLAVDNISIIQQYEYPTLTQAHTLVVADAALDLAFDAPVVTHNHMPVVLADITHALAFEAPVLTQAHVLAVNDAAIALAFDAPALTQAHTLVVADADIDLAFESPAASEDVYELVVGTATVITLKAVIVT